MAQPWAQLKDLGVGAKLYLPVQITGMTQTSITIAVLSGNPSTGLFTGVPSGSFTIDLRTGLVNGQWVISAGEQPAWVVAEPLVVGDLLEGADGAVSMAKSVGLGNDGTQWSPYPNGISPRNQDGFTKVGHVDL